MHRWAGRACACVAVAVVWMSTTVVADEVDDVLTAWAARLATAPTTGVHGVARLYTYDVVFETETRRRAEFWIRSPTEWRVDLVPQRTKSAPSSRQNSDGVLYQVKSSTQFERWVSWHDGVGQLVGDAQERPFLRRAVPVRDDYDPVTRWVRAFLAPSRAFRDCHIPWQLACLGLETDSNSSMNGRSLAAWKIKLGPTHGKRDRIHLMFDPTDEAMRRQFSRIEVLLNQNDYSPIGVRWFDPAGTAENVYAFEKIEQERVAEALDAWELINWPPRCEWISLYEYGQDRPPAPPMVRTQADAADD